MSLPWVNMYVAKMFMSPAFLALGIAYFFEGLRRAYLGGLSLGLFIDLSSNPPTSCQRDLIMLRTYLDKEKDAIEALPHWAWPLIGPWIDYHNAAECFYEIAEILCAQKAGAPTTAKCCEEIWYATP
jgi:hypothetical protein